MQKASQLINVLYYGKFRSPFNQCDKMMDFTALFENDT